MAKHDRDWMEQAACRDLPIDTFFPTTELEVHDAQQVCRSCPVSHECLMFALNSNIVDGIWGGMTWQQRRTVRRRPR